MEQICDANGNCYTTLANINTEVNPFGINANSLAQNRTAMLPTPQVVNTVFNQDYYYQQQHPEYALLSKMYDNQFTQQNSFENKYLKPLSTGISTLGTLGSLWLGFKQYGLMKDQLGMAKEQWNRTKQELDRIQAVRKKLTDSYMNS